MSAKNDETSEQPPKSTAPDLDEQLKGFEERMAKKQAAEDAAEAKRKAELRAAYMRRRGILE